MYSTWRVQELKEELKKRGASLRGRKAELVERLEIYDKNFNFGHLERVDDSEPVMQLPKNDLYRDINSDTSLPAINQTQIRHYLNCTEKKINIAKQLYESRHLMTARLCIVGEYIYVKAFCKKTMKNLQYEVDVKLDEYGNPEESHCECPAGSGTNAVCKHVAVVLLAVEHMKRLKIMLLSEVSTQKLQQFHVPKRHYMGTPVKAEKMVRKRQPRNLLFNPYPIDAINKSNYNMRLRSLVLNFENSKMPMKQLYEPANPYANENDHCYIEINPKIRLLKELYLIDIMENKISEINQLTVGQSENSEWHKYRKNRLTASNFHTICHLKTSTKAKYATEIFNRCSFYSRATAHGLANEKIALSKYSIEYDLSIEPCGLIISKERPFLAASPDGLLNSDTIIEIKCPYASRFQAITPITVPYIEQKNNTLCLKKSTPYYFQIQGQLYCSNRKYCNLIIYTYKDLKILFIDRDETFIQQMLLKLDDFYENYFQTTIFNRYLYYNYELYAK